MVNRLTIRLKEDFFLQIISWLRMRPIHKYGHGHWSLFFPPFLYWFFMHVHVYPCREKEDSSCLLDKKWVDRLYDLIILSKCFFFRPVEVIFICSNWFFLSFVQLNNINNSKLYSFSHFAMKNIHVCVLFICVLVCKKLIKEYLKKNLDLIHLLLAPH